MPGISPPRGGGGGKPIGGSAGVWVVVVVVTGLAGGGLTSAGLVCGERPSRATSHVAPTRSGTSPAHTTVSHAARGDFRRRFRAPLFFGFGRSITGSGGPSVGRPGPAAAWVSWPIAYVGALASADGSGGAGAATGPRSICRRALATSAADAG